MTSHPWSGLWPSVFKGVLLIFAFSTQTWAGPPFETDDPEPTDFHHWEIYAGTTALQYQNDFSGTGPFVEINYGAFTDTQLSLTEQVSFNSLGQGPLYYGYGDTLLGLKYRFIHESEGIPQVAFYPQMVLPTGDYRKGLGEGQFQFLIPLWAQKSWGPWTTYGGGLYWIYPGLGNKNWTFWGWEVQRDLGPHLALGGEIFYHSANQEGESDNVGFNLGGFIHFDQINHIVFSAGRDILRQGNLFTGYLAYEWTFPKD